VKFTKLQLPEVILVESPKFNDDRGYFSETYHIDTFKAGGIDLPFVQDNHVKSKKNVLRGLHFQVNFPQGKLVRCISGEIFDVAVDIRKDSPSFGKWVGEVISEHNRRQLYIPPGFAHGYCVLSDESEVLYKCTDVYHPNDEKGIAWNDPQIGIKWPINTPVLSEKDRNNVLFDVLLFSKLKKV